MALIESLSNLKISGGSIGFGAETIKPITDRGLPERSKLIFYFPKPEEGESYFVVKMPFFENIEIKERKKARYQSHSLISRSSNLYTYLGADSRKLSLSFKMSFPHILLEHPEISTSDYVSLRGDASHDEKIRFREPYSAHDGKSGMAFSLGFSYLRNQASGSAKQVLETTWAKRGMSDIEYARFKELFGVSEAFSEENIASIQFDAIMNNNQDSSYASITKELAKDPLTNLSNDEAFIRKSKIIDLIIYWTNIIRASVVNNANNPLYGPPIIRVNHGIMYQDVPCICKSYSISHIESAGYDLKTLLPNQLKFTMDLEEIRAGDFGEFEPGIEVKKDNLAGWEAVIEGASRGDGKVHSMDPGY